MRFIVGSPAKIGLIGRNQRQAETVGEPDKLRLRRALGVEAVALDLDIEPRAKGVGEACESALGQVGGSCFQGPIDRPGWSAGECDQPLAVHQRGERNMGLVAVGGIEPQGGDEPHQIAVAGLALR